jgi:transposase-like protein
LAAGANAARRFFQRAIGTTRVTPSEGTTDKAPIYPLVLGELPAAWQRTDRSRVVAAFDELALAI